jgi:hypothetical protein
MRTERENSPHQRVGWGEIRKLVFICPPRFLGVCLSDPLVTIVRTMMSHRLLRSLLFSTASLVSAVLLALCSLTLWEKHCEIRDQRNLDRLNGLVAQYRTQTGRCPDINMIELFRSGMSDQRLHKTPYGGYYQIDVSQMMVYNPQKPRPRDGIAIGRR